MRAKPKRAEGFTLAEVVIAIGIAATVLVALVALTGTALNSTRESVKHLEAAGVASQLITQWSGLIEFNSDPNTTTPATLPSGFPISGAVPDKGKTLDGADILINQAGLITSNLAEQEFRIKYSVQRSTDNPQMLSLYLLFSWPAQAPGNSANNSRYEVLGGALLGKGL